MAFQTSMKKRFLKDGAVPSIFPWWTPETSTSPSTLLPAPSLFSSTDNTALLSSAPSTSTEAMSSADFELDVAELVIGREEEITATDQTTVSVCNERTVALGDRATVTLGEETEQYVVIDIIQETVETGTQVQVQVDTFDRGAQTRESGALKTSFSIHSIKDNTNAIKFYTSFESYDHFRYVLHCLGPNAYELDYKSRALDTEDEFFLFMVKLRRNSEDEELSYQFGISRQVVGKVFNTWLNFLFFQLQETVKFLPRDVIDAHMPKDFKAKYPSTRVILDATEVFMLPETFFSKMCAMPRFSYTKD